MWRPDRSVRGPDRPGYRDIDPLNRVFAEAFTDRYSRDGLVGVRVPQLNPLVWRYAIDDAGDGAMVWRDAEGHMVAFNTDDIQADWQRLKAAQAKARARAQGGRT